ncbi:MAG: T9SS type A sorting domain-containing protein [Ignavibacteriales bacterium]|nr:MAG: T9SS type A sorting domain-containing protein [Ignavibacteriales bacterium]
MKKSILLITITFILLSEKSVAQPTLPRIQMPYGIGNVWIDDIVDGNDKNRFEYIDDNFIIDSISYWVLERRSYGYMSLKYARIRPDGYHVERVDSNVIAPNYEWIHWKENPQIGDQWINQWLHQTWRYQIIDIFTAAIYGQPDTLYGLRISLDGNPYELFALYSLKFGILSYTAEFETTSQLGCVINGVVYGDTTFYPWVSVHDEVMESDYRLEQNYPNPFNPSTTIQYGIESKGEVSIGLFDILGKEVMTIERTYREPGNYEVQLDASSLSSGVYFYVMKTNGKVFSKKLTLLK